MKHMRREIISAFQRNRPHVKIPTRTRVMAQNSQIENPEFPENSETSDFPRFPSFRGWYKLTMEKTQPYPETKISWLYLES